MLHFFGTTSIDFVGKRAICWGLSAIALTVGISSFVSRGSDRYGIDFTGGVLQEYRLTLPTTAEEMRSALSDAGVEGAILQQFGSPTEWLIRTSGASTQEIEATLSRTQEGITAAFADSSPQRMRVERVGSAVGKILRSKAWMAILWSMIGILLYVAVRFRHFDFGVAALLALTHDVVITAGALCLTGRQIDLVIVAALMTIAGYSVNDTIVIYDRVRENSRLQRKLKLSELLNLSINHTLARTILTSMTTLIVVIALYTVGGPILKDFAFALMIGFITGTYSTIYIASGFVILWQRMFKTT